MYMNNQLKLLIYIFFVALIFLFVQDRFEIFDISLINEKKQEENIDESNDFEEEEEKVEDNNSYVEIFKKEGVVTKVDIEVADTQEERVLGLSNRRYLGDYEGMLFIFDQKVNTPFWMKDMYFPLDIIFIDESNFIIDKQENREPCTQTYCPMISSSSMYKYVLEVNAGFCESNGIVVGSSVVLHLE